jgi:YspA, cpYpsA-related SLOG family
MIRLLVTGGRDFTDQDRLWAVLDAVHRRHGIEVVIEGECPTPVNADKLARAWAESRGVACMPVPVCHALDGPWPGAGPNRNTRMLAELPTHCIGAPTPRSRGTWDMVRKFNGCGSAVAPAWVITEERG